jgi:hypothetical protein
VKALFADLSEHTRTWRARRYSDRVNERRHVLALFDAIQVAITERQHDRVGLLLQEMHVIVESALARRNEVPQRISA